MKKRWLRKGTSLFLCGLLIVAMLVGCGSKNTDTAVVEETSDKVVADTSDQVVEDTSDQVVDDTSSVFGQLTAINGNTLTIALFEAGEMQTDKAPAMPSGETEGGEAPTIPNGETEGGEAPTMPSDSENGKVRDGETPGENPSGGFGNFTLTGEVITITADDTTSYIINGSESSLSELQADDIVTVEMSGDIVVSITVGMGGGPLRDAGVSDNTLTNTK